MMERNQSEHALCASQERFRLYFDLGLIGMAITSPSKGVLDVNDECCRMLGYERHELLHLRWDDITHPDDVAADVAHFDRALAGEIDRYSLDKRWIRKDGRVIDTIMSARCVRRANGSVDFFVGLIQDITDRKETERKLAESERRFHVLVESIPHHVWSFEPDRSRLGYWNQRMVDYTGLEENALRDGGWAALHPDEVERAHRAWRAASVRGAPYEMEHRLRGRDGQYRRFVRRAVPVRDGDHPVVWFGTDTDVEDRRRAEEAARGLRAELAHAARVAMMGALAASIAHEVNQPLAALVTNGHACIRWLGADQPNLDEASEAAHRIVRDASRAAEVIARIRTFLNRGAPHVAPIDLHEIVVEVVAMIKSDLVQQNVTVDVAAAPTLPPVGADRIQIQQVLLNLAMNAVEAMATVTDRPRLLEIATALHGNDAVRVAVRDSGAGFRAERRRAAVPAVLHDEVTRHGDRPRDQPLDRRRAWRPAMGDSERGPRGDVPVHAATGAVSGQTPIVLVVDDDRSVREATRSLIASAGLHVETFASADEFLSHGRPAGPACVVLDVRLPGLSGLDLQQEMSKAGPSIPIVFITGHGDIPMSVRAMKAGAVDFLTKPFSDRALLAAVRQAIERDLTQCAETTALRALRSGYASLTRRQRDVMALVVAGLRNKQIAARLGISEISVKVHRASVMRKMAAGSLAALVRMAGNFTPAGTASPRARENIREAS